MPSRQLLSPSSNSAPETSPYFLAITVSASLIILFAILYFLYYLWFSLVHRSRTSPFDSSTASLVKLQRFTYRELKNATNGFSDSSSIGKGGSGTVYRGNLKDGKVVAVKLLDSGSLQSEREFQNELQILGGLRSPLVVNLLGYCVDKSYRIVVYEFMPNRSLQESLFSESSNLSLNWGKRFEIISDIAQALAFLHLECDPPVIHGDVKPSNVLLDSDFRAKLSDFGLSRLKSDVDFGVDLFSQELGKSQELSGNLDLGTPVESEVDFALALQASSSSTNNRKPVKIGSEIQEGLNSEHNGDVLGAKQWGKDWWWKQEGSEELCSKDYVMEWIGSQISESTTPDWDEEKKCVIDKDDAMQVQKIEEKVEIKSQEAQEDGTNQIKKHKKMQEWWKEEHLDGLTKKKKARKIGVKRKNLFKTMHLSLAKRICFNTRVRQQTKDEDGCDEDEEGEFSFRKGWKNKKNGKSVDEMWSGDLFSRELSSTTSMRGTLCYIAPEYGGCGYLMENSDIYSFGVLILVIVSGRRPLHVLASPMKLERANLISWCRHLAQVGNVLEVMDEKLKDDYNKEQASLCVHLALSCLQKVPEMRPNIHDIVKILKGEMELGPLPFEFSPSPPSRAYSRSRRRLKSNPE